MKTFIIVALLYLLFLSVVIVTVQFVEAAVEIIKKFSNKTSRKSKRYWVAFPFKVGDKVWISKPCLIGWETTEAKVRSGTVRGVSKVAGGICISFSPDEDPEPRMWSNYSPKDIYLTKEAAERAFEQEHKEVVE
jgi:hypothetical protein